MSKHFTKQIAIFCLVLRGGSRTDATSKMERFVIIVNGWKPLTIITKRSILDVAAVLDPPLVLYVNVRNVICSANQLTGFYVKGTLTVKGLITISN